MADPNIKQAQYNAQAINQIEHNVHEFQIIFNEDQQSVHNKGKWNKLECLIFNILYEKYGKNWKIISKYLITRTVQQIISHSQKIEKKKQRIKEQQYLKNMSQGTSKMRILERKNYYEQKQFYQKVRKILYQKQKSNKTQANKTEYINNQAYQKIDFKKQEINEDKIIYLINFTQNCKLQSSETIKIQNCLKQEPS